MGKATRKTATATAATVAATAATAATTPAKSPWANMDEATQRAARSALASVENAFGALVRSEHAVARSIGALRQGAYHVLAGYSDFASWVEAASERRITRTKAGLYDQASSVLSACSVNLERKAEAEGLSISTLAKVAGAAKAKARNTTGSPEDRETVRESTARKAVSVYAAKRSTGATAAEAEEAAGIAKPKAATAAVDFDGMVRQVAGAAMRHADNEYSRALSILTAAMVRVRAEQTMAAEVAAKVKTK